MSQTMASPAYKLNENGIPRFEDLPLRKGDPHHSAWGLYGENDELGTLNRLTDERVVAAARAEIKSGVRYINFTFLVARQRTNTRRHSRTFGCFLLSSAV